MEATSSVESKEAERIGVPMPFLRRRSCKVFKKP